MRQSKKTAVWLLGKASKRLAGVLAALLCFSFAHKAQESGGSGGKKALAEIKRSSAKLFGIDYNKKQIEKSLSVGAVSQQAIDIRFEAIDFQSVEHLEIPLPNG